MQVSNAKEEASQEQGILWPFIKYLATWLVIYIGLGIYGGIFHSTPGVLPAGMSWVNADAASPTFFILRGGQHLIVEQNAHSQMLYTTLFTAMAVMFMYIFGQARRGKLKDRQGEPLSPLGQMATTVGSAVLAIALLAYTAGWRLQKATLDLDPAGDSVTLNGHYLGSFTAVSDFRYDSYVGYKGGTSYSLTLELSGEKPIPIGSDNADPGAASVADYLNNYLAGVRRDPGASTR